MKNYKSILSASLAVVMGVSLCVGASAAEDNSPVTADAAYKVVKQLPLSANKSGALYETTDEQGNAYGPSDYSILGNKTYILNTANNSVFQYQGNRQAGKISLDSFDIVGTALAVDDNEVFVLDNNLAVSKIEDGEQTVIGTVKESMDVENAVDFKVSDQYVYVSEPTAEGGKTHLYLQDANTGALTFSNTVAGYMVDENTFYRSVITTEDDKNTGHVCTIYIMDASGQVTDTITLTSENEIAGAQYLGKNAEGKHIVKQFDMACYADGTCDVEETIRTIDSDNALIACTSVEPMMPSLCDPVTVQDGAVYQFDLTNTGAAISEVKTENMAAATKFVSKLEASEEISAEADTGVATRALTSISRTAVMNDAKAYHSSFTWSCTSKNLAALSKWTRPRYVTGAGTYSYMPYCWGGFSTTAQYKTGMSNSGRVGNINTSSPGHVANTYGLDCSGYVSRCWRQSTKYGTSTIGSICNSITYSALKPADALNKSGSHIVIYECSDGAGNYVLYEATTLNQYDKVSHTNRPISSLSSGGYVALRYQGITG